MSTGLSDTTDAAIFERLARFLELAGVAPADPSERDEVRRRALMQLDLEDEARHQEVMRRVDEALAWYPDAAEMADFPDPWLSSRGSGNEGGTGHGPSKHL